MAIRGLTQPAIRRSELVVSALGAAVLAITACSSNQAAANGGNNKGTKSVLTIGVINAPTSLNPPMGLGGSLPVMASLTNEKLLTLNRQNGSVGPGLATSYRYVGSGNRTFEVTLRHDVRFSDGEPMTAQAVKAWIEYFAKTPGPNQAHISIQSVATIGKWKVQIHLAKPNPEMPFLLAGESKDWGGVSSPRSIANPHSLDTTTSGAGPYAVEASASVPGDHYTLVPNKDYYNKSAVHFSKIVIKVIPNPASMLQAIQTGQIDVAQGDASTADSAATAGLTVAHAPAFYNGMFIMDLAGKLSKPLADPRVRQALNYAVNRAAISKAIIGQYGMATSQVTTQDGQVPADQNYYTYDPKKAKSLLSKAGYKNGFTLRAVCQGLIPYISKECQIVAQNLKAIGVQFKITSPATANQATRDFTDGTFPVGIGNYPIVGTWELVENIFAPKATFNQHGWDDPVIDRLWHEGTLASSAVASTDWKKIVDRITKQADILPILNAPMFYYASKDVHGVSLSGSSFWDWDGISATEWSKN